MHQHRHHLGILFLNTHSSPSLAQSVLQSSIPYNLQRKRDNQHRYPNLSLGRVLVNQTVLVDWSYYLPFSPYLDVGLPRGTVEETFIVSNCGSVSSPGLFGPAFSIFTLRSNHAA